MAEISSTAQPRSDQITEDEKHSFLNARVRQSFKNQWPLVTHTNHLALFGFRRFRTGHLLNLRLMEEEIKALDHNIFQAGLMLEDGSRKGDRLGIAHAKRDPSLNGAATVDHEMVLKLRSLLKDYGMLYILNVPQKVADYCTDEALIAFNEVMTMEAFALADHQWLSSRVPEISGEETYRTRLVRIDRPPRSHQQDILALYLRKFFRLIWFQFTNRQRARQKQETEFHDAYQNTALIADTFARFLFGITAGALLIIPVVILSRQSSNNVQLLTVSLCIIIFSFLVALVSRATHQDTMAATAAYAAVLVVFVSNKID